MGRKPEHAVARSDDNQPVYAVAPGVVAQAFGGCLNANDTRSYGQVLIEHDYQVTKWWMAIFTWPISRELTSLMRS